MSAPTKEDLRAIHEHAITLEKTIKAHTKVVFDQYGTQVAMNALMNVGVTVLAGGLSYIENDSDRFAATVSMFIAIVEKLQLEMAGSAAESIIKKAMKK